MDHLATLNDMQREAVTTTEGPLLVLAGAGAGKTKVITHRILEIVRRGTAPEHILAITFTNKAAAEMRERTQKLLLNSTELNLPTFEAKRMPFISTFHSLGLTVIKENYRRLGFKQFPVIFDRADSMRIVKDTLKSLDTEEMEPRTVLSAISKQKGEGRRVDEYEARADNPRERLIASVWRTYDATLHKEGALDFDDLLVRAKRLLAEDASVRAHYQARWTYIHIDEYQDTNRVQAEMADLLLGPARNICAVGDVDQTIYGWRGAEIANIISFEKKYQGAKTIKLEQNYRSTKNILAAANSVIAKNVFRPEKNLFTTNPDGELISQFEAYDEMDEAGFIARTIREQMMNGAKPRDFAILYRANFQSRALEEAMLHADIPHQVLGTRFFERKEVKDVLSYIRAALSRNSADISRTANSPARGIGKVTLLKLLAGKTDELTGAVALKVQGYYRLLDRILEQAAVLPPSKLVTFVMKETGMERELQADRAEGAERLENIRELVSVAARYDEMPIEEGLQVFLENAALASDQDSLKDESNAVRLMTVHASKGLEFPQVFVTGMEEGLFPYEREGESASDKEEERRLCYVAITRAAHKLYLTYTMCRTIFGAKKLNTRSQFFLDIDDELLVNESPERLTKTIYLD